MFKVVVQVGLVLAAAVLIASCGGQSASPEVPTQAPDPATATTGAPASTPTTAATAVPPTEAPTQPPTAEPSPTVPRERVAFNWAPGSVPPSDADDVDLIAAELIRHEGILSANGNETVLNVFYNPELITVEEIMEVLRVIGHPVILNE